MTKQRSTRWMPVLLLAPVVAGMFGVTTTWALTSEPVAAPAIPVSGQTQTALPADLNPPVGPSSFAAQLEQNEQKIAEISARLEETKSKTVALQAQTGAVAAPDSSSATGGAAWQAPSSAGAQASSAQAPSAPAASAPAPAPAPPVNATTRAS